jgi:hypothetical protein
MVCKACGSVNETKFSAEINIHFPGPINLDEPGFFVFPNLAGSGRQLSLTGHFAR